MHAMYRPRRLCGIFFPSFLSQILPSVLALQLHLPNQQMVRFGDDDIMSEIFDRERDKKTMLTAFFETNRVDETAKQYLYKIFQSTSHGMEARVVGIVVNKGLKEDYLTFRRAALEIGLIENDDSLSRCLTEASLFQFPKALRGLFATILVFCKHGDVRNLWNDHFDSMFEDYRLHCQNIHRVQDMVVADIRGFLQSMGKDIKQFDLPEITQDVNLQYVLHRELQEEYMIVVEPQHLSARDSLNCDKKIMYDEIMMHVDNDRPCLFFIDGPGGKGKTFVYKALLAQHITLATASSGAAANNMPGGRTAHSRFKIPINLNNNPIWKIKHQSGTAELIRSAKLIIWDEASMAKRQGIEAVDRTLQDIVGVRLPFGGKIMAMGGDFRQVFPVTKRGTRAQIVDSSLRMSPLWSVSKKMWLTINIRALNDSWFSDFLLRFGDGTEESIEGNFIHIPDDITIPFTCKENSIKELFNAIFPSIENSVCTSNYIAFRAILSTRNESVDEINDQMIDNFDGEEMVYYSFDEVEELLSNRVPKLTKCFHSNAIDAEIVAGQHSGERVFLIRILLSLSEDDMFPFDIRPGKKTEIVMEETRKKFEALSVSKPTIEDVAMQEANKKETQPSPNVSTILGHQPPCESLDNMFADDKWWLKNQDKIIRI
ncbi:uncharacterized protein LOC143575455 [Bidens hawaiensis]|uniref:uncharacterized protein LOC143575455 n=1 Tax=Bidens hawaiensis TaxID=980011 RepID=UPI00404B6FAF